MPLALGGVGKTCVESLRKVFGIGCAELRGVSPFHRGFLLLLFAQYLLK
jgi:hypothetical protein